MTVLVTGSAVQELEAKFLTTAGKAPDRVLRRLQESLAWAGFRIQPQGRRDVTDTYFDTADQRLRVAGWSYRQREDAAGRRVALKELNRARAAIFDREEVEQPVSPQEDLRRPGPGPVQERLSNLLHPDAAIAPLFTVHNRRSAYQLSHPDHPRGLVEMAFDDARVRAGDRGREGDHLDFTELELELKSGPHELLASILAAVELEPAFVDARLSKYERGLITAGCPLDTRPASRTPKLDQHSRWLDVAIVHLKAQLRQMRLYEPYAWEGIHVEGVHQMRVAIRRARAALRTFAGVLPAAQANRLGPGLRWLARMLGAVRDLDVHMAHLGGYRDRLESYEQHALDRYEAHLLALHDDAHLALIGALDDAAYDALIADFRALLAAAAQPAAGAPPRVHDMARTTVVPLLERVRQRGRQIDDDSPADQLHRLRIDVKRLRYQLEFIQGAYGAALDDAMKRLKKLQDLLGLHQDACVARAHLAGYRREHAVDKWERRIFKRLIRHEKKLARRQRKRFGRAWTRFEAATEALPGLL